MALKRNRLNELHSLPSHPLFRTVAPLLPASLLPRCLCSARRMEQFPDGHHVRLRSRVCGRYLHADEDGRGISLRARRASHNAAWAVHVFYSEGLLVLLQGAAYGRYLAATQAPARPGHQGFRAEQRDFDYPDAEGLTWQAVRTGSGNDVLLLHVSCRGLRYLRANGRYLQWQTGVTVQGTGHLSTMMHWVVEPIPPRDTIPPLPLPRQQAPGVLAGLLGRSVEAEPRRTIWYVRAGPDGSVNENAWVAFRFTGRSVANLRSALALRLGETVVCYYGLTMCARPGQFARLTPIVVDLPLNDDPVEVVILMAGTPAIQALRHPDVDAA